jgi:hypothetical protein
MLLLFPVVLLSISGHLEVAGQWPENALRVCATWFLVFGMLGLSVAYSIMAVLARGRQLRERDGKVD